MKYRYIMIVLVSINAALLLSACTEKTQAVSKATKNEAAKIEKIAGSELNRVILSEKAAQRLDIQTAPAHMELVKAKVAGHAESSQADTAVPNINESQRLVIPYSSVLYDVHGKTWVYVMSSPLTFVRQAVTVDFIDGDKVVLVDGPPTETMVVTVGAAELYGADTGVGK